MRYRNDAAPNLQRINQTLIQPYQNAAVDLFQLCCGQTDCLHNFFMIVRNFQCVATILRIRKIEISPEFFH